MNYKIIHNANLLTDFVDNFLPDLLPSECYYICLFARKKYCQEVGLLKSDNCQLKRMTSKKEFIFDKLKQMECELGSYIQNGNPVPQEALVAYINPNPRCLKKAAKRSLIRLAELITEPYSGYNPHQEVLSEIQKACSRKLYIDFDYDVEHYYPILPEKEDYTDEEKIKFLIKDISCCINIDSCHILRTRGGIHCLVEPSKVDSQFQKSWYLNLSNLHGFDESSRGDNMIPIPGCTQGGFTPYFER